MITYFYGRCSILDQKTCIITGANSGIGKTAAIEMARRGFYVVMACRSRARGEAAREDVMEASGSEAVEFMLVDLSMQASIRTFAEAYLAKHDHLDVLINNAAVFDISQKTAVFSEEGIETFWATNHIGPVLLTTCLLDALKDSPQGRILSVSSKGLLAKPFLQVDLEDPEFKHRKFTPANAYYQAKRAQVMYTRWLAKKLKDTRITVNCIRVPAVRLDESRLAHLPKAMKKLYAIKSKASITPEAMADVYTHLATSEDVAHVSGMCFDEKSKIVQPSRYAQDPATIENVMNLTQSMMR